MRQIMAIALAGALGTLGRYWLSGLVQRHGRATFPVGTLAVNLLGCLFIGLVMEMVREHPMLGPQTRSILVVGFLGGFTTFSAFGYETAELLRGGSFLLAALNVGGSIVLGLLAVSLGAAAGRVLGL